ncbi:MAG: hypothetical protein AAGL97_14855 [Pseudomonadota bacterium]
MPRTGLKLFARGRHAVIASLGALMLTGCVGFTNSGGGLGFMPAWSQPVTAQQSVAVNQSSLINAAAATFIVKFKNEPALEQVCRNFRRDEAATRKIFNSWAAQHPQLKGLKLVRASYSGDIILALPANDPEGRTARDVIAALETLPNLAYAEIDSMASASAGN